MTVMPSATICLIFACSGAPNALPIKNLLVS
jgi:hypothetical protein